MCSMMCGVPSISTTIRRLKSFAGTTSFGPPSFGLSSGRSVLGQPGITIDFTGHPADRSKPQPGVARNRIGRAMCSGRDRHDLW
jgi:hypothetical protein